MALAAFGLAAAPAAQAAPSTNWRDYRAVAANTLTVGFNLAYSGAFGVINPGGSLQVQINTILLGPYAAADSVDLESNASVQDLFTNSITQATGSTVNGAVNPVVLPLFAIPALPPDVTDPCTQSAAGVLVPSGQTLVISPGCFGDVVVNDNARLELNPGNYKFKSLSVRLNSQFITHTPGKTTVNIAGEFNTEQSAVIKPASGNAADLDFFVGGDAVNMSKFGGITGAIFAPNAIVTFEKEEFFSGPVLGAEVHIIGTHTPGSPTPTVTPTSTPTVTPDIFRKARLHLPAGIIIFLPNALDSLALHLAVVPNTPIDPLTEPVSIKLSNVNGTLFSQTLPPGSFKKVGSRFLFKDPTAKTNGGLYSVIITKRTGGVYRIDVQAYKDLSAATLPDMTINIALGNDQFASSKPWTQTGNGWVLSEP
jgi:hypothetical protein